MLFVRPARGEVDGSGRSSSRHFSGIMARRDGQGCRTAPQSGGSHRRASLRVLSTMVPNYNARIRLCASIQPALREKQVDRFLAKRLGRGFFLQGKLAKLFPGERIKIDRQDTLSNSARWARGSSGRRRRRFNGGCGRFFRRSCRCCRHSKKAWSFRHWSMPPFLFVRVWACLPDHIATSKYLQPRVPPSLSAQTPGQHAHR